MKASLPGGTDGPLTTQGQLGAEMLSVAVVVSPLGGGAAFTELREIVTDFTVFGTYCGLRELPRAVVDEAGPPMTKWVGIVVVPPPPGGGGAGVLGVPMGFPPPPPLHAASAKTKTSDNVCRRIRNWRPSNQQSE